GSRHRYLGRSLVHRARGESGRGLRPGDRGEGPVKWGRWKKTGRARPGLEDEILSLLARTRSGLTDEQLEEMTGQRHQSVSPARFTLEQRGLVKASRRRRQTDTGTSAIVWVAGKARKARPPRLLIRRYVEHVKTCRNCVSCHPAFLILD